MAVRFRYAVFRRDDCSTIFFKAECVHALKGLVLPRASHSGDIALTGSRRLHSTLAAAPVLFAHAAVTVAKIYRVISPNKRFQHGMVLPSLHTRT